MRMPYAQRHEPANGVDQRCRCRRTGLGALADTQRLPRGDRRTGSRHPTWRADGRPAWRRAGRGGADGPARPDGRSLTGTTRHRMGPRRRQPSGGNARRGVRWQRHRVETGDPARRYGRRAPSSHQGHRRVPVRHPDRAAPPSRLAATTRRCARRTIRRSPRPGWHSEALPAAARDADDFYFDAFAQVHMESWSRGRVTLCGDAGDALSRHATADSIELPEYSGAPSR